MSNHKTSFCPPAWSTWSAWSVCDNFSRMRVRQCGDEGLGTSSSSVLCDGGLKGAYEYAECDSSRKLVMFGGEEKVEVVKMFNIDANSVKTEFLTPKGDASSLANGSILCSGSVESVYYVVIGVVNEKTGETELRTFMYNWTKFTMVRSSMSMSNRENAACTVYDNQVWLCGGWNQDKGVLGSCEVFDGRAWRTIGNMVDKRNNFAITYEPARGLVLVGGISNAGSIKDVESYHNGRFGSIAPLKHKLAASQAMSVDGSIYTFGGLINGEPSKFVFRLGVESNEWQLVQRLKTARAYHTIVRSPLDPMQLIALGGVCTRKMIDCDEGGEVVKVTREWDGKQRPDFTPYLKIISQRMNGKQIQSAAYMP